MTIKALIVTPDQLKQGYPERVDNPRPTDPEGWVSFRHREYKVIQKLDDGNYLVEDPSGPTR